MTYPVNSQIKPYQQQQPSMGYNNVPLQGVDGDKLKDNISNNDMVQRVKKSTTDKPWFIPALMLPIWAGFMAGMTKFNHACANEADGGKDLMGKVRKFGNKLGDNGVTNSKVMTKVGGWFSDAKRFVNAKIINKNRILSAMFNTPSKPENKMVLTVSGGTLTELAGDASSAFEEYEHIGKSLKDLGLNDDIIKGIKENSHAHIDDIINACRKAPPGEFVEITKIRQLWNMPLPKILHRKIYFSEIANKLEALKGLKSHVPATAMGKMLPKGMIRVLEGMTNGTAGGKLMMLMQAYIYANAIKATVEAPKGEKLKTFMENAIYDLGWYLMMPFGIGLMHKAGGLQYIGMSKEQVATYRKNVEAFNAKAKVGGFASRAEYVSELKSLKAELKGGVAGLSFKNSFKSFKAFKEGVKGMFMKPLKWAGRVVAVGLETPRGFVKAELAAKKGFGAGVQRFFRNFKFNMKNFAAYPMRFGLFMFVIAPFLGKLCAKGSHAIFGRPTKSVLDDEDKTKEKEAKTVVKEAEHLKPRAVQPVAASTVSTSSANQNLMDAYKSKPQTVGQPQASIPPQAVAQQQVTEPVAPQQPKEPPRKYVPSPVGVKIQPGSPEAGQPTDKVSEAFNKAEYAEKQAMEILGGH